MAKQYVMINDIIEEHNARMYNLRKYYPFFVLSETAFTQYRDGRYNSLDMGYITMAVLRFFIEENNFNERDITYPQCEAFIKELLIRDFDIEIEDEDMADLILYIFDKIRNDGKAFEFTFYDPGKKQKKTGRVRLIDSRITDGKVLYYITADGIEFYLDTKEIKDESKINVEQVLLEKMITGENFKGGIEVVKRINSEVNRLVREKDDIVDLLSYDVFAGAEAYEKYMKTVGKWFSEEQKLFAKNKALVDKAVAKANFDHLTKGSTLLDEISQLELELKKTILKHGNLINSTMELQNISDNIIQKAKLKRLRPVFDFEKELQKMIREDRPDKMGMILAPLFAPAITKSFSMTSIDNLLTLKSEDEAKMVTAKKEDVNGVKVLATSVEDTDMNALRNLGDDFKNKLGTSVVVLASAKDAKVNLIAMATDDAVKKGAHAGNIIKASAALVGGGGGGRPNMAQAGGKNPAGIADALAKAVEIAKEQLNA